MQNAQRATGGNAGAHSRTRSVLDQSLEQDIRKIMDGKNLQSWPNVVERKVRFHFFTLNLNNNSPLPPTQCCLGLFSARNKNHTISFINASINIEKGARGSSFFCEICENITTCAPLRTNQLAFHKLLAMIV